MTRITHVGIVVGNLEESVRFYQDVLGLAEARRLASGAGTELVFLKGDGDVTIELMEDVAGNLARTDSQQGYIKHVAFEVADMETSVQLLQDQAVTLTRAPITGYGGTKIAFFLDPNGIELEFVQEGKQ